MLTLLSSRMHAALAYNLLELGSTFTWRSLGMALILLLSATLAHTQDLDPRCSDPTAKGQFSCTIDKPNVTQRETVVPNVVFVPGDNVVVGASGCVQTGGAGRTWKLFVNPSGPNADHLYHGLIRIPTATPGSGLVRIRDIIGKNLKVAGNVQRVALHLGYEDDDYSDNGYNDPDDGTDDQCKNIGPAQVRVVITRGATGGGGDTGGLPFNLKWTELAPGGLPFNPQWAWQQRVENVGAIPDTSLCHNFSKTVQATGPNGQSVAVRVPDFADCTDQTGPNNVDLPEGFNQTACSFGGSNSFSGHLNWFPVTFEGHASWGDHGIDDDYTFEFRRDGNPLSINGRAGLHVEFDSEETIDNFTTDEWKAFHQAVDDDTNGPEPKKRFDGHTILTGMFGLDCEHDCKSELHPLYALATKRDNFENDSADEVWLMFVRNVGNEGYCSHQLWKAPFTNYTFRLPWRDGMSSVEVVWGVAKSQFKGTAGTAGPTVNYISPPELPPPAPKPGVYVSFSLPPASQSPLIEGALHLKWIALGTGLHVNPPNTVGNTTGGGRVTGEMTSVFTHGRSQEIDEAEHKIRSAINQLPPAQRLEVQKARASGRVRAALHALAAGGAAQKITAIPAAPSMVLRLDARAGNAARKQKRDAAQMRALCAATNNAPAGLPANVCRP